MFIKKLQVKVNVSSYILADLAACGDVILVNHNKHRLNKSSIAYRSLNYVCLDQTVTQVYIVSFNKVKIRKEYYEGKCPANNK